MVDEKYGVRYRHIVHLIKILNFDQLAKILTGYEITGARSSGIFMGILFIAVGFLFKITAVPFRAAVGRTAPYR